MSEDRSLAVQPGPGMLSQLSAVRSVLAPDLNDAELQLFAMVSARSGLDPFAKQIYAIKRQTRQGPRLTFQTGIDGLRSIAARTNEYDGQDSPEFGPDCGCGATPKHPEWCEIRVYRKGVSRAIPAKAYWHEYLPDQDFQWRKMPHVMLAKVAEALALRKAFPWDPTSGSGIDGDIYTSEEMDQADRQERQGQEQASTAEEMAARAERLVMAALAEYPIERKRAAAKVLGLRGKVSDLTPEQRGILLSALMAEDEAAEDGVVEGESREVGSGSTGEPETGTPPVLATDGPIGEAACDAVSTWEVEPGAVKARCVLPKGHRGAHGNPDAGETWPQDRK